MTEAEIEAEAMRRHARTTSPRTFDNSGVKIRWTQMADCYRRRLRAAVAEDAEASR